jgi:hypothetical protein
LKYYLANVFYDEPISAVESQNERLFRDGCSLSAAHIDGLVNRERIVGGRKRMCQSNLTRIVYETPRKIDN